MDGKTERQPDRHRLPARRPARAVPREGQPGAPLRLPRRRFIGTIGKGMLGLTVNCARCHDHKFDPIPQKDYYALQASIFGYVETEVPLAPPAEADGLPGEERGDRRQARRAAERRSPPSRSRIAIGCELEQIKTQLLRRDLPGRRQARSASGRRASSCSRAGASKRSASPATQIDKVMTPDELAGKQELDGADRRAREGAAARRCRWPRSSPTATTASRRSARATTSSAVRSAAFRRRSPGSYLHKGPGRYEVAAVVFPDSRRRREPRARR